MATWGDLEICRISHLTDEELLREVQDVIIGRTYSWKSIHRRLRELNIDYSLYCEWNRLCNIKQDWEKHQDFDVPLMLAYLTKRKEWRSRFYRDLLITLKLLPLRAGLEASDAFHLVHENADSESDFAFDNPWEDCERWRLCYLDRQWEEQDIVDEEQPLLIYTHSTREIRPWWKWF